MKLVVVVYLLRGTILVLSSGCGHNTSLFEYLIQLKELHSRATAEKEQFA